MRYLSRHPALIPNIFLEDQIIWYINTIFIVNPKLLIMKKAFTLLALIALCFIGYSASNPISFSKTKPPVKATEVYLPLGKTGELISLMDLSVIGVKEYESLTGKKMKFLDKVNFKIGQRQLKKCINNDGTFSKKRIQKYFNKAAVGGGGVSILGLALGLLLSIIGVLIAYLLKSPNKKSLVTWAWIGFLISLVVWGAVII